MSIVLNNTRAKLNILKAKAKQIKNDPHLRHQPNKEQIERYNEICGDFEEHQMQIIIEK
ncbi:hypothetical protein [Paenibacillus terrae]|nr:hypothetical protein [Paenibacillus terrae]